MATAVVTKRPTVSVREPTSSGGQSIPRALRRQAEGYLVLAYPFMDTPMFKQRGIEKELFTFDKEPQLPLTSWYQPTREDLLDSAITGAPQLMTAKEERVMFLRFNFAKRKLMRLQNQVKRDGLTKETAELVIEWHRRFEHFREYLVRTTRTALKANRYRNRFPVEFEPDLEKSDWSDKRRDQIEEECIDELKTIVDRNMADLSDVEQTVIRRRFNWQEAESTPLTLEEVGKIIGVTKERVRQIQNKALAKIKAVMEESVLRTKTEAEPAD